MAIPVTISNSSGTAGTLAAPTTPTVSETISRAHVGKVLEVFNGSGGSIDVTFTDPGRTPAGNTGTQAAFPVAAGARRRWRLTEAFVNSDTKVIAVTFSAVTSVTAEIIA